MSSTLNIPGIAKIEYMVDSGITLPSYLEVQPELDISALISGSFTEIEFIKRSASLNQNLSHQDAGDLFEIELPFNMAGNETATIALLKLFRTRDYIFRVTDTNGQKYLLAHPDIRPEFTYKYSVKANPSGQRGYNCKIILKSPQGLIFII